LGKKDKKESSDEDAQKKKEKEKLLSYLLFISAPEVDAFKALVANHREEIAAFGTKKKLKASDIPESMKKAIKECLSKSRAVDVALFGRMLADLPEVNQDAACQVAHAISTHKVDREFDYFTAVDDMGGPDETGAGMIGQVEFNSATFYRYAVVDTHKLLSNLQGDVQLTLAAIEAFAQAMARAIPTGKQNTFAAHNPPSFVGVCIRHAAPLNLANAFEKPILPRFDRPLTLVSVEELAAHEAKLAAAYADPSDAWGYLDLTGAWPGEKGSSAPSLDALAAWAKEQAQQGFEKQQQVN
jgi:CRISPR system Cascade subunit CasC